MKERSIREIFDVGIILKGVDGVLQVLGGILLFFIAPETINRWVVNLTQYELVEDPKDKIANYLASWGHLTANSQKFAIWFLLLHGGVKIFIVAGLLKNKLWAYPLGIFIFSAFGVYQIYRYTHTHSLGLILLTVLDAVVIALTVHEYRIVRNKVV